MEGILKIQTHKTVIAVTPDYFSSVQYEVNIMSSVSDND